MTPYAFAKYRQRRLDRIERLDAEIDEALRECRRENSKPSYPVRPATQEDLIPGDVIWHKHYPNDRAQWHWQIVYDPGKTGYTSVDGDSYHLNNAFVELKG